MFPISILMPETFQVRVPVSVPSSPGVPRGMGVGDGKGEGEFALASHKIEYLHPRMGCKILIG